MEYNDEADDRSVGSNSVNSDPPPKIGGARPPKKNMEEGEVEAVDDDEDDADDGSIESKSVNSEYDSQAESDGEGDDEVETEEGVLKKPAFLNTINDSDSDAGSDDDEVDDHYLQKFDESVQKNVIAEFHPELQMHNNDEIEIMSRVVRNEHGTIIDPFHKTVPFITRYEKARIIGERAKQIDAGAPLFIDVEPTLIDGYMIALKEYEAKKIPFIVKRPLPSGGCEYWKLADLEYI